MPPFYRNTFALIARRDNAVRTPPRIMNRAAKSDHAAAEMAFLMMAQGDERQAWHRWLQEH